MAKTLTFGIMHLGIAFGVTYTLTGSLAISGAITFIEPAVNTVAHYFFDKYWTQRERRAEARKADDHADRLAETTGTGNYAAA